MLAVSSAYKSNWTWRDVTGMPLTYRLNNTRETSPPCATAAHISRQVDVSCLEGRLERPVTQVGRYYFYKARGEVKDGYLKNEYIEPNGIEGLSDVVNTRSCQSLFAEVSGFSFNEAG